MIEIRTGLCSPRSPALNRFDPDQYLTTWISVLNHPDYQTGLITRIRLYIPNLDCFTTDLLNYIRYKKKEIRIKNIKNVVKKLVLIENVSSFIINDK